MLLFEYYTMDTSDYSMNTKNTVILSHTLFVSLFTLTKVKLCAKVVLGWFEIQPTGRGSSWYVNPNCCEHVIQKLLTVPIYEII